MPDLLIELLSEEIPARMQPAAAEALRQRMTDGLVEAGLTYAGAKAFATPRRLALTIHGLSAESPTLREERKGPRTDAPDKALEGFLRATGLSRDALEVRPDKKGEVYFATLVREGRPAAPIVAEVLEALIRDFPWPKSMRWGGPGHPGEGRLRWVRPLRSILCVLTDEAGSDVVAMSVEGLRAGAETCGHRFLAPEPFSVSGFEDYEAKLARAHVVLDPAERRERIRHDASNAAFALGLEVVPDEGLLSELAGLAEDPVVLVGEIAERFLELPAEVLQISMRTHQKFLSLREPGGRIVRFATVSNQRAPDDGATILDGNARVLAARLSDAVFFWEGDLAEAHAGMGRWRAALENVTFQSKLGSQADRIDRIAALAGELAPEIGAEAGVAAEAARVAKLDLESAMVGEFPELQGVMGSHYARAAGFAEEIAAACAAHYGPLGPSDAVPSAPVSVAVALADKLDTLTGFWAIGETPTGSKDPFALRRAGLGVIRLILDNDLRLPLGRVIFLHAASVLGRISLEEDAADLAALADTAETWGTLGEIGPHLEEAFARRVADKAEALPALRDQAARVAADLLGFLHDRLKVYLRDRGLSHDVIDACLARPGADDLSRLVARAQALGGFLATEDGENLVQGFRRANNILAQAEAEDGVEYSFGPDPRLAEPGAEAALFEALDREGRAISSAIEAEDFASAMRGMASLRPAVDAFFEAVQVNADNQTIRRNRLNLLHRIRTICGEVADLSRLAG